MTTVDGSGRIAGQTVFAALGWTPGLRIDIHPTGDSAAPSGTTCPVSDSGQIVAGTAPSTTALPTGRLLVVGPDPLGGFQLTTAGHLRLPAHLRRASDLHTDDRVLLAADRTHGRLIICPPATLDTLLAQLLGPTPHSAIQHQQGGDQA